MVCLDTDFLIEFDRRQPQAVSRMEEMAAKGEVVYTTIINVSEYYAGAFKSKNKSALRLVKDYLEDFSILQLDEESALIWARLYNELRANKIGDRDLFIASIALSNKQALVTRNKKHFERVLGLEVEGW